jgi:superfamily II DNA helicase RecQ
VFSLGEGILMLIKVISLPFDSLFGGFRDDEVREFLKDKELISSQEYFFVKNDIPYLSFVLRYFPNRIENETKLQTKDKQESNEEWKKLLTDADMGLFNILRDWRSQRCKKDGVPPYILFTNQQLAMIVKKRPQSISELTQIDGIGKGKAQKYGEEVLSISKVNVEIKPETTEVKTDGV